ncbi:nuclear body protein SP140-like protein isoform X2 [Ctenopharyngodon idella]|nr:nuclear body protein SP140-like protein isoform X2 [Ctenopharyngodon idella]XP_051742417.1 nuclear body protein SP140-like protein isoform X2 [Ctenopharyngodon idella]XP_051742418.1 nuclear body protein SP140-like protein isoform X2 [Ctenopharyngodon idella]XP_051742419.1 nuclear body protein SP140-like protein isoform X2 [Ctenopharyngodon idella]XP_051742420.1 nuclear body protein SP140-like protein isoform X2 [Ctenopharyngodon idella]XP_051742421.1 nuclear body protein SP140-like protein 
MVLDFLTDEELYDFFRKNKTKISTIEEPLMFLRHLKDNRLITDELYQKLENSNDDNDMYHALEYIQKCGKKKVRKFWECVDQEHILQRYPQLSEITETLKNSLKSEPNKKTRERSKDRDAGREREVKKRKTEGNSVSNQAGPSSQSTKNQRKKFEHVDKGSLKNALKNEPSKKPQERSKDGGTGKEREIKKKRTEGSNQAGPLSQSTKSKMKTSGHVGREEEKDLWDMPEHKEWLPVRCGEKEALLNREKLRGYNKNRKCIKYRKEMITPSQFEEMAGKEKSRKWKTSILCQDKTIQDLLDEGRLEMPGTKRRNTYRE